VITHIFGGLPEKILETHHLPGTNLIFFNL
jgi:hypothetical protein